MKKALIWTGGLTHKFNSDEWDSFRGEGRMSINMGFGLSSLGYSVNIAVEAWDIDKSKKTWNDIELSKFPLYDYYDLVMLYGPIPLTATFKFEKAMCIVHENSDVISVKTYMEKTGNSNVTYAVLRNDENYINKIKDISKSSNVCYLSILYPIASLNVGFLHCTYNPKLPELKIFLHYASWDQGLTISGDRFILKEQLIINYLKTKGYKIKLTILVQDEKMVNKCHIKNNDTNDTNFVYSVECSYHDIIKLIQSTDICITNGSPVFPGNSLTDMISLGKPIIYIGDGRIGLEWNQDFPSVLYKDEEIRNNYIIYTQETDKKSIEKLNKIMVNPLILCDKYSKAFNDNNFDSWKVILEKALNKSQSLIDIRKRKTVAVYVSAQSRNANRNDQYDSFRSEGRIVINMGFGLGNLGFDVHIINSGWSNDLRQVYKNVYLTNKPQLTYYDYALTFQIPPDLSSNYGTVIFMGYEPHAIDVYYDYVKNVGKNIIYTYPSFMNFEKHQSNIPFKIHYLPVLFPIPSINCDGEIGFLPYNYNPKLPTLKIFMFYSSQQKSTDFNKVRFLDKEIFIVNYLKNKGYILNLNVLIESSEYIDSFPVDKFISENETQHELKFSFSNESSHMDIINYIRNSDICITVGGFSSGNCLVDMISLGKPTIFIGDGIPLKKQEKQKETIRNIIYKHPEELIYIQEPNKNSLIKIEKFMSNPKISYDKFKSAHSDFDFNNWKKIAKTFFVENNTCKTDGDITMKDESNKNTHINKFGDGISWENHVHEITDTYNVSDIFHSPYNVEKINHLKKYKSYGKVLDCGCHVGRWIEVFRSNNYDYTGVDQSLLAIETFRKYKPDAHVIHSLLWNMAFNNEFDIVHTNAVLQHNTLKEQEKILPKIHQALKLGGIFIISESTVTKQTLTQRTYKGWISFIEKYGFKFMESWNKNELNLDDNYLFIKIEKLEFSKNITKEKLQSFCNIKEKESTNVVSIYKPEITIPEIIIPESPKINVLIDSNENKNKIYMNEYWTADNTNKTISLIECIKLWRNLKVGDKCYFIIETKLTDYVEQKIKNIFKECGFKYIKTYTKTVDDITDQHIQHKLEFEKLSITKIRNWEQLRYIHGMLNS